MDEKRLITEYLCWIMNRAQLDAAGDDGYLWLCEILQNTEFHPVVDMDENRCDDCEELRHEFVYKYGYTDEWINLDGMIFSVEEYLDFVYGDGTMMELMVVLSEKMRYELTDSKYEASTRKWFLEMLSNCGLSGMNNKVMKDNPETVEAVTDILNTVIFRKTGWDGEGGFFPLRSPRTDQREEEFTNQMNYYIEENYDIL